MACLSNPVKFIQHKESQETGHLTSNSAIFLRKPLKSCLFNFQWSIGFSCLWRVNYQKIYTACHCFGFFLQSLISIALLEWGQNVYADFEIVVSVHVASSTNYSQWFTTILKEQPKISHSAPWHTKQKIKVLAGKFKSYSSKAIEF